MTSPLWCANDDPHPAHRRGSIAGGFDYCSGRPEAPKPPPSPRERAFEAWVRRVERGGRPYWKITDHATAFAAGWEAARAERDKGDLPQRWEVD